MDTRRKELGDFLMAMRQKCQPEAYGFPAGQRRRTQGLRREEVAQLTGISPTWYTWIEQGREVSMSVDVLDRLAKALRMERSQRAYLFELAGKRDPHAGEQDQEVDRQVLVQLVNAFDGPAYILGRAWDVLAWNARAQTLFAGWLKADTSPNLLEFVFLDAAARELVVDWETRARRLVAEFRADCSTRLDEPELGRLLSRLAESPEFARYWKQHDVLERQGGRREFEHAQGRLSFQQITLKLVDQEHIKLVLLMDEVRSGAIS